MENAKIENAYYVGWQDGRSDRLYATNGPYNPEELVNSFNDMVEEGVFKPFEKEQYIKGYRRGANGEKQ